MAHDVFISYSSHDKLQADAICSRLEAKGIRCWIAPRDVPVGSEYAGAIVEALESSRAMVLVYSANAEASHQVRRELERAVSTGVTIVPVRIEAARMSKEFEYYVGSIHWLDAIDPPLEAHIDKLARDLSGLLHAGERAEQSVDASVASTAGGAMPPAAASFPAQPVAGEPPPRQALAPPSEMSSAFPVPAEARRVWVPALAGGVAVAVVAGGLYWALHDGSGPPDRQASATPGGPRTPGGAGVRTAAPVTTPADAPGPSTQGHQGQPGDVDAGGQGDSALRYAAIWIKAAGPSWRIRSGLDTAQYQQMFDNLVPQGYRPVSISGYDVKGEPRYAAIFEQRSGPAFAAFHGLDSAHYKTELDKSARAGYKPVFLNVFAVGGQDFYSAVFEKAPGEWVARHALDAAAYQDEFALRSQQGYRLVTVSGCEVAGQDRYAAIWERRASPPWATRHGMSGEQYQQAFDQFASQGYHLTHVSAWVAGGQPRFAAIWEQSPTPPLEARANLSAAAFRERLQRLSAQGYRMTTVTAYRTPP